MNLALLRVCAIVFVVNILGFIISMLFMAVHAGELATLWNALTSSSFEDLLGMGGLLIASGVFIPLVLGALAIIIFFALGILALVKKSVKALKILAVLFLIWVVLSAFAINPISGLLGNEMREVNLAQSFISLIFNINVVVAVAAFFVVPKKRDESEAVANEDFNLGLFRLCAICFAVSGLNSLSHFICVQTPVFQLAFFGVVYLAVGVFALVKKNVPVLVAGSLMILIHILFNLFNFIRISGLDPYIATSLVFHSLFHTSTVIAVAVFFVKPEWVKKIPVRVSFHGDER
jgi:hypothetical protein